MKVDVIVRTWMQGVSGSPETSYLDVRAIVDGEEFADGFQSWLEFEECYPPAQITAMAVHVYTEAGPRFRGRSSAGWDWPS